MKTHFLFFCGLLALLIPPASLAATYKWRDEQGNVVYSQTPPPDGAAFETIKTVKPDRSPPPPVPTPETSRAAADLQKRAEQRSEEQKAAGEKARDAELRAKNCQAAKHNLEVFTVFKRIRKENGEVVRIPDDERARKIEEYQKLIKEYCD